MKRLRPFSTLAMAVAVAIALLTLGACAGLGTPETSGSALILSRLYFGTATPTGTVPPADFDAFLDTCVTSRFPAGLTRYAADGQWRGGEIIERYKARFAQEAVLLVEEKPSIRF